MKKKMYVLLRKDLEPTYRCVQGGHALVEFANDLACFYDFEEWNNDTLIYLMCKNIEELEHYFTKIADRNCNFAYFEEPDLDYQLTAIACYCDGKIFKKLPLAS